RYAPTSPPLDIRNTVTTACNPLPCGKWRISITNDKRKKTYKTPKIVIEIFLAASRTSLLAPCKMNKIIISITSVLEFERRKLGFTPSRTDIQCPTKMRTPERNPMILNGLNPFFAVKL
ncbi:MAG TPA: hypothetical protein VI387_08590, partial [Candidatus Brocadiales bacterium]|nr:hypothetical protein [Candidatus Brocadiales bacterium]